MGSKSTSVRFDANTLDKLDEIAARSGQTRSDLIKQAVDAYLDRVVWFEKRIRQGIDDIEAEQTVTQEQVKTAFQDKSKKAGK